MGGNTSTHVANDFTRPIYVMVDAERRRVVEASVGIDKSKVGAKADVNCINAGFTKILPKKHVRFDVDCTGTSTAYISVFYIENGESVFIANALPRKEDLSVIITKQGQLCDSVYGNIWKVKR